MNSRWGLMIFGILFILLGLGMGIAVGIETYEDTQSDEEAKLTSCYDQHNNVIKGLECEENEDLFPVIFLCFMFVIMGISFLIVGSNVMEYDVRGNKI